MDTYDPMEGPQSPDVAPQAARPALALVEPVSSPEAVVGILEDVDAVALAASSQCVARSKQSGEQCKRRAIPGGKVCVLHGGKAPQVQAKALLNLRRARDAALDKLNDSIAVNGENMDPRALLDIVVKLTDKVELLEGRATERTESSAKVEMEARSVTVRASIEAKLEDLAARLERQAGMTDG